MPLLQRLIIALVFIGALGLTTPARAQETLTSKDGAISVITPPGDDWECFDRQAQEGDSRASLVKCRSTNPERFFFMIAKVYTVPADQVMAPRDLVREVYLANYERLFESVEVTREAPRSLGIHEGYELNIKATHARKGIIHKREWVLAHGASVVILSAEGSAEVFEASGALIDAWMTSARFEVLDAAVSGPRSP